MSIFTSTTLKLFFIIFLFIIFDYTESSVAKYKPLECECYNATESCKDDKVECEITDPDKSSHCFVLWTTNNVTGDVKVSMKGCFTNNAACNQTECIDNSAETKKNFNFCCCKGNMCNRDQKWIPITTTPPNVEEIPPEESYDVQMFQIIFGTVAFFIISISIMAIAFVIYRNRKTVMFNEIPANDPEISNSCSAVNTHRPIVLLQNIARGRFGIVWSGQLKDEEVAVKIIPLQDKDSWRTEQDIFTLPRMNHPNILEFIDVEKHCENKTVEFWLITAYHPRGSLYDYLKANTVSWSELCKIAESMANGLMHLHEEIPALKGEGLKPAIAHRDFKSKNVLLKSDLTACIADFGLALVFQPGKPCGDTHGQVGTRRYMAPEVLEGAINFTRDAFLRIDVYACGLVLWELASRCTAHNGPVAEYALPFDNEFKLHGKHPSIEEMQENIVIKKLRPQIHSYWRSHAGLSALCDTMEECWDHDAEARLSSSCVMERVSQHRRFPTIPQLIETTTNDTTMVKDTTY